jgi:hypothetical protein
MLLWVGGVGCIAKEANETTRHRDASDEMRSRLFGLFVGGFGQSQKLYLIRKGLSL